MFVRYGSNVILRIQAFIYVLRMFLRTQYSLRSYTFPLYTSFIKIKCLLDISFYPTIYQNMGSRQSNHKWTYSYQFLSSKYEWSWSIYRESWDSNNKIDLKYLNWIRLSIYIYLSFHPQRTNHLSAVRFVFGIKIWDVFFNFFYEFLWGETHGCHIVCSLFQFSTWNFHKLDNRTKTVFYVHHGKTGVCSQKTGEISSF